MKQVEFSVNELSPFHRNPRRGNVEAIAESLSVNGQYRPIVVNIGSHTGRPLEVLAGNHTLLAARSLKWPTIAGVTVDVDDEAAERIVLADNRTADLGGYDDETLVELLGELEDLAGTGYTNDAYDELVNAVELNDLPEVAVPESNHGTRAAPPGKLLIGRHEVLLTDIEVAAWHDALNVWLESKGSLDGFMANLIYRKDAQE